MGKHLPNAVVHANFASAQGIRGDIIFFPSTLEFANFRESRMLTGSLHTIAGDKAWGKCNLKELNLRMSTPGKITGILQAASPEPATKSAANTGLFNCCPNLRFVDLGNSFYSRSNL